MAQRAEIYLVPGFLGFVELGELDYYLGAADVLRAELHGRGIAAVIHCTSTIPAGTVRQRAAKLAHEIARCSVSIRSLRSASSSASATTSGPCAT